MVDPRGGAFTVGLGLLARWRSIPAHDHWSRGQAAPHPSSCAPTTLVLVGIDERTALIRDPDGAWRAEGAGEVAVFVGGDPADLSALRART